MRIEEHISEAQEVTMKDMVEPGSSSEFICMVRSSQEDPALGGTSSFLHEPAFQRKDRHYPQSELQLHTRIHTLVPYLPVDADMNHSSLLRHVKHLQEDRTLDMITVLPSIRVSTHPPRSKHRRSHKLEPAKKRE